MKNHTTDDHDEHDSAAHIRAGAAEALVRLTSSLHSLVFHLKDDMECIDAGTQSKERGVKDHLAEISILMEAGNGEGSGNVVQTNPGNTLDLDAARTEISSRLTKLAQSR